MSQRTQALRVWIWFSGDGTRWQVAKTKDGYWHCALGLLGGKRLSSWEPGFPPGLGPLPEGFESR
ncbi:MAG: hypothetical protein NPIRA02_37770 [Nitrospirales bacterium]|nr:MAG: hypothetical protein NPIRA02_37770 [Nitrospirales bacterium]